MKSDFESSNYLEVLSEIEVDQGAYNNLSYKRTLEYLSKSNAADCFIDASIATEAGLISLFNAGNVPDSLFEAYNESFSTVAENSSLFEHFSEISDSGDASITGFISNLKGKAFELELADQLEGIYEGFDFKIAESVTQELWDIEAISADGLSDFFVQAKMYAGSSSQVSKIIDAMESNPSVMFATSNELREAVLDRVPDLEGRFIPEIDISDYEFTESIKDGLDTLVDNMGIDMPDEIGDFLPYIGEIVLGIRLIMDVVKVHRDFRDVDSTNKAKISAVKALVLFSRFGVTTVVVSAGSAAGTAFGPVGNLVGGIGGAFAAAKLNNAIKPKLLEIGLALMGLTDEDMFYFNNKKKVDALGISLNETAKELKSIPND